MFVAHNRLKRNSPFFISLVQCYRSFGLCCFEETLSHQPRASTRRRKNKNKRQLELFCQFTVLFQSPPICYAFAYDLDFEQIFAHLTHFDSSITHMNGLCTLREWNKVAHSGGRSLGMENFIIFISYKLACWLQSRKRKQWGEKLASQYRSITLSRVGRRFARQERETRALAQQRTKQWRY